MHRRIAVCRLCNHIERIMIMDLYDSNEPNGWTTPSYDAPQADAYAEPAPETPVEPESPVEPEQPEQPVAGETAEPESPEAPAGPEAPEQSKPAVRSKAKASEFNPRLVRRVREALALLESDGARALVAAASRKPEGDVDRLAVALLDGEAKEPAALLVALHDEPNQLERMKTVMAAQERDTDRVKAVGRMAAALNPDRATDYRKTGWDLAGVLAETAGDWDVEAARGLAK